MAGVQTWSTSAANNNAAAPDGWPEGMAPSSVNDAAREVMAAIATWYQAAQWQIINLTPTFATATTFTVTGDQTATFTAGRRIRAIVTAGTIYGYISTSAYTTSTLVTCVWDSTQLDSGLSSVAVHILTQTQLPKIQTDNIDDDQVTLAKLADQGSSEAAILAYDGSGNPTAIQGSTTDHVLRWKGTAAAPAFEAEQTTVTATDSTEGIVDLATQAEMEAETSGAHAVTPDVLKHHPGIAKAWAIFDGTDGSISASYNVDSVTVNATAKYTVALTTAFSSANYAIVATASKSTTANGRIVGVPDGTQTTSGFDLHITSASEVFTASNSVYFACYGDQ